jgi:hypothetical protein
MAHFHLNVSYKTLTIQNRCHTSLSDYFFLAQFLEGRLSSPRAVGSVINLIVNLDFVFDEEQSQDHHDRTSTNQKMQQYLVIRGVAPCQRQEHRRNGNPPHIFLTFGNPVSPTSSLFSG